LLYLEGERSIAERYLIRGLLSPGMRVVDVGVNIGNYLLMFERGMGPSWKIVCITPSPWNLPGLKENIRSNGFGSVDSIYSGRWAKPFGATELARSLKSDGTSNAPSC
jgi:FkbM family methyltransferase